MTTVADEYATTAAWFVRAGVPPKVEVHFWVTEQLMRAGIEWPEAAVLAATPGLDWHEVVAVLERGATPDQVARIFL